MFENIYLEKVLMGTNVMQHNILVIVYNFVERKMMMVNDYKKQRL